MRKHQGFGGSSAGERNPPKHEIFIAEAFFPEFRIPPPG